MSSSLALCVEYDGTDFCGFQSQAEGRSVQDTLEKAISTVADHPVQVAAAGRTDAGVHATSQVVSFLAESERPLAAWTRGVNACLPADVRVWRALNVSEQFHARFDATFRRYMYVFGQADAVPAIARNQVAWLRGTLHPDRMSAVLDDMVGERDFSSFRASGCQSKRPWRQVDFARVVTRGELVVFDIQANAFLLRMVRNLAGALLEVSRGSLTREGFKELMDAKNRDLAPPTAPARGLYLVQVGYPALEELSELRLPPVLGPLDFSATPQTP